jgi:ESCRT-II complex subunit VPS22
MSAIDKSKAHDAKFQEKSTEIAENQLAKLNEQMESFRSHLQSFATKHKKEIRRNPVFRRQFQEMCAALGVDPLQSSSNFWTKLLGVGDFYYELAVQVVEVCMATSHRTGGFMQLRDLLERVKASRNVAKVKFNSSADEIEQEDLLKAIEKLSKLGGGIKAIPSGKTFIIQSVPSELSMDSTVVLLQAQESGGHVDLTSLINTNRWSDERATKVVNQLVMEAVVWVDNQAPNGETWYWFPGLV